MIEPKELLIKESELLSRLPKSWADIALKTYIEKLIQIQPNEENETSISFLEDYIKLASIFLELPESMVRKFPYATIARISDRLSFISEKPKAKDKPTYKWIKRIDEPDYDTFIFYLKSIEQLAGGNFEMMYDIVDKINKSALTREQIEQMPMDEAETGFFLLRKSLMQYAKTSSSYLLRKGIRMEIKQKILRAMQFRRTSGPGRES